jgi:CheY-like chemotaxis protein
MNLLSSRSTRAWRHLISPSLAQAQEETMTIARVLMVEDEHLVAQALQRWVAALGHTVVCLAASGKDVIAQADTLQPDVVLMAIG